MKSTGVKAFVRMSIENLCSFLRHRSLLLKSQVEGRMGGSPGTGSHWKIYLYSYHGYGEPVYKLYSTGILSHYPTEILPILIYVIFQLETVLSGGIIITSAKKKFHTLE